MIRIALMLVLACASFAQEFTCASVRYSPFGATCFELPNYEGRARSLNPKTDAIPVTVPKLRFVPAFLEAPYVQSQLTGEKFALSTRFFATKETAEWLAKKFGAVVELRDLTRFMFKVSDPELWLVWPDGTSLNAGDVAMPYTNTDMSEESCEAVAAYRIEAGREEQRRYRRGER
jgi:hypothetical protein